MREAEEIAEIADIARDRRDRRGKTYHGSTLMTLITED
jgi:hypothetical protein